MRNCSLIVACAAFAAVPAAAQLPYPAKPLKMIMSFPAGGPTDILGRLIGQKLTEAWGHNVVIDNRPGGGGVIGAMLAVKSPPDGYTMYLGGITTLVLAPMLREKFTSVPSPGGFLTMEASLSQNGTSGSCAATS